MMFFMYSAYGNDPIDRRSTTRFSFTFYRSVVVYKYKTQSINELSSTEEELASAVTVTNTDGLLRSMLL